jgi:hypothetical protein
MEHGGWWKRKPEVSAELERRSRWLHDQSRESDPSSHEATTWQASDVWSATADSSFGERVTRGGSAFTRATA